MLNVFIYGSMIELPLQKLRKLTANGEKKHLINKKESKNTISSKIYTFYELNIYNKIIKTPSKCNYHISLQFYCLCFLFMLIDTLIIIQNITLFEYNLIYKNIYFCDFSLQGCSNGFYVTARLQKRLSLTGEFCFLLDHSGKELKKYKCKLGSPA